MEGILCQTTPKHTNRLGNETSPYLLQHAYNPVDWYPWGEEALARAKVEDKPILLSIGYSACHWCHVMERESFENEEIAAIMNQYFVNVKVDREERPDSGRDLHERGADHDAAGGMADDDVSHSPISSPSMAAPISHPMTATDAPDLRTCCKLSQPLTATGEVMSQSKPRRLWII